MALSNAAGSTIKLTITNASRSMLFNLKSADWDDELLELLDIPRRMLPEIHASSDVYGQTAPSLFGQPLKIAGIAGDQQAALFGQNCVSNGMVKNTYGTGCFMLMHIGDQPKPSHHRLLTTTAWQLGAQGKCEFAYEGSIFIAGAAVQWIRDGLKAIQSSAEVEQLMQQVPDTDGVYLVPAFVGLGAPYWDPRARGVIVGLTTAKAIALGAHGVALGTGTDIAIESADVVLMSGDLRGVAIAIALSKATIRNIKQNLFWAFAYNVALIPVAAGVLYPAFGWLLSPMLAAAAMGLSSVFVLTNALRLKAFRQPRAASGVAVPRLAPAE